MFVDTGKATVPTCDTPQHVSMSRHSGWRCACGDWHPWEFLYALEQFMKFM